MKTIALAACSVFCAPFLGAQNCVDPADQKAIGEVAVRWKDGYNSGNAAAVAALYAEDATYLTQHFAGGVVQGRSNIQAYFQKGVDARYRVDRIEILSTGCSGELAYTVGKYESTNGPDKAHGVNIVVLRKFGTRWLIVAHESAVPDATAMTSLR